MKCQRTHQHCTVYSALHRESTVVRVCVCLCITEVGWLGDGTALVMCDILSSQADIIGEQQLTWMQSENSN